MYHKMIEQLPDHEYSIEQIKAENEKLKDELNTAEKAFYEKREAEMSFFTYDSFWQCSEFRHESIRVTDYCPFCGAEMDEKEDE